MYKATAAQHRCRAALHKHCPPSILETLTPNHRDIARLISPTPLFLLRKWVEESGEEFWVWLLSAPACDGLALQARDLAYASLIEILDLQIKRDDGSIDTEILKAKQKAIDTVLAKNVPLVAIQNNNAEQKEKLPIGISRHSETQLKDKLSTIQRHLPPKQEEQSYDSYDTLEG